MSSKTLQRSISCKRVTFWSLTGKKISSLAFYKLTPQDLNFNSSTDIAWSPYFNLLSGLCTEIGGLISHGAVVARECNLPCIVGASRATDKIKHGDQIYLNADEGVIARVSN